MKWLELETHEAREAELGSQIDRAVASVRGSRAARSFVAAGANNDLPPLNFRMKGTSPFEESDDRFDITEALMVVDRSGALVPAADFYECLRQYFFEVCALYHAVEVHIEGWECVDESTAFKSALGKLRRAGHLNPMPWPLERLLGEIDAHDAHRIIQSHLTRRREAQWARLILSRRSSVLASSTGPRTLIEAFIAGFLPRSELPAVMNDLVRAYHQDDNHRLWDASLRICCSEPGSEAEVPWWSADVALGLQACGSFYERNYGFSWSVAREGESEGDSSEDEAYLSETYQAEKMRDSDSFDSDFMDTEDEVEDAAPSIESLG